jgi:hypothetical protein
VHVPVAFSVTVVPETLQTLVVCELKLTARPEVAVALTVKVPEPRVWFASAPKAMVWVPRVTWKVRLTGVAAAQSTLPACAAWIVQEPTATSVTVAPDTVHVAGVVELKVTASPDDAVALTVNGAVPNAWFESVPKVMVWLPCITWKLWLTGGAAAQLLLPACVAWMVQVPRAASVTVAPDIVHTAGVVEAKLTARPDDAVALTLNGAVPYPRFESAAKVMVWLPWVTWKLWFTGVAASQLELPAWVAWIVQVPTATNVTVPAETVHTRVFCELKPTLSPELAVALTANGAVPKAWFPSAPNVMV